MNTLNFATAKTYYRTFLLQLPTDLLVVSYYMMLLNITYQR